jgi:hypothetical protein
MAAERRPVPEQAEPLRTPITLHINVTRFPLAVELTMNASNVRLVGHAWTRRVYNMQVTHLCVQRPMIAF